MARPIKNTVDYFPHIVNHGKTIFILESKFGNDGYAFWFKLLELLGTSHDHVYNYSNPVDWEFLLAKTKVSEDKAHNIIKTLAEVGAIDSELLEENIIWCENFVKGVEAVYKNRRQELPKKPVITRRNPTDAVVSTDDNTQTIVKETIVNKTIVEEESKKPTSSKIKFNLLTNKWEGITDEDIVNWEKFNPGCNVKIQLATMREWLMDDPTRIKKVCRKWVIDWIKRTFDDDRPKKKNKPMSEEEIMKIIGGK